MVLKSAINTYRPLTYKIHSLFLGWDQALGIVQDTNLKLAMKASAVQNRTITTAARSLPIWFSVMRTMLSHVATGVKPYPAE